MNRGRFLWFGGLPTALLVCIALSVSIGVRRVSLPDILAGLGGSTENIGRAAVVKRVPRTFMAALAGAALGVSGVLMQGVTRNPLADPGILGVNSGAAFAVTLGIAYFDMAASYTYVWTAIGGAAAAAILVYMIGSLGAGGAAPLKLALAGTAASVCLSSLITAVLLPRNDIAGAVRYWLVGGVGGVTLDRVALVLPFIIAGFVIGFLGSGALNSLALGDELGASLGENVPAARIVCTIGAVMLCGAATAVCGPIGFVGLAVPHAGRMLIGLDHRRLVPFAAFAGALFLIIADILGRVVARPGELEVGIVTAFFGAPVFIWIVRKHKVREL